MREALTRLGRPELIDAAELGATELATNACLHAQTPFVVSVFETAAGTVRVAVTDGSPLPPVQRDHRVLATTGRGLRLLGATGRWGVEWNVPGRPGKTVWFEPSADPSDEAFGELRADDLADLVP